MNKTIIVILGVVAVAIVGGVIFYATQNVGPVYDNGAMPTSTVVVATDTSQTANPGQPGEPQPEAQQPGVPGVTTDPATVPADTTVVVTGKIVSDGVVTSYWYEYGTSPSLGSKTSNQAIGSGYSAISAPGYITGLLKDTKYYFRLVAENQYGTVAGAQYSFQTTHGVASPVGSAPTPKTSAASGVSKTDAVLNGTVTPNGAATQYWFEYGQTTSLGSVAGFISAGDGAVKVPASISLSGLNPGTTYYFRLNAQNQFGTVIGPVLTFKTSGSLSGIAPTVTTTNATAIATSTATLNGSVDPNSVVSVYWFEYSSDPLFGSASIHATDQKSAGVGSSKVSVAAGISGLASGTTYYFRTVAQSSLGTVRGSNASFKTK